MTSREWARRGVSPRARERLGALGTPRSGAFASSADTPADDGVPAVPARETDREPAVPARETDREPARVDEVAVPPARGGSAVAARDPEQDAHDVLARLRSGALSVASTAYTAAHGHPLEHPDPLDGAPARRWALTVRSGIVVALALLVITGVVVLRAWTAAPEVVPLDEGRTHQPADSFAGEGRVVVHVVGEVRTPGVVELAPGARVAEAVEAAGGPSRDAMLGAVNLARVVADGEQIIVPSASEDAHEAAGVPADGTVDINTADAATLETLPGVGPVLAGRILEWRATHGRFTAIEELTEVSGIGPSLLARLRDLVRI